MKKKTSLHHNNILHWGRIFGFTTSCYLTTQLSLRRRFLLIHERRRLKRQGGLVINHNINNKPLQMTPGRHAVGLALLMLVFQHHRMKNFSDITLEACKLSHITRTSTWRGIVTCFVMTNRIEHCSGFLETAELNYAWEVLSLGWGKPSACQQSLAISR